MQAAPIMRLTRTASALARLFRRGPVSPQPAHTSAPLLHYLLAGDAANVVSVKAITEHHLGFCADVAVAIEQGAIDFGKLHVKQRSEALLHAKVGRYVLRGWMSPDRQHDACSVLVVR